MRVAKQAVAYYCNVTGNDWSDFFSKIDDAKTAENPTKEQWLIKHLLKEIVLSGVSEQDFLANKDAIKGTFDEEGRKKAGEFFTPIRWCEEGRSYFDKHIPNWKDMNVWDGSCGSGNLMRTAKHNPDKLFLSSLQEDDVTLIKNTPEYKGITAFQLDFLNDIDVDKYNCDFIMKLPERLQEIIRNDEPLIFYMNPPYKAGSNKGTAVGRHMTDIGLSRPACDIYYQFMWRVMNIVDNFNLSNCYFACFGPLTFFTGVSSNLLLSEFEHCFEFVDGMCLSAQEFSDTSSSIVWGIGCSLWKSRGGYMKDQNHKDILLEKKFTLPDGTLSTSGRILYELPRTKLSEWVVAKDIMYYEHKPLMTSHLTFKGSQVNEKVAPMSGKFASNALGTLMTGNTLTRSSDQSAILSMPTTIQSTYITEENFWRCVSSFGFRRTIDAGWAIAKKDISAPNENIEGYDIWLANALVLFLFEYKSMMSSIRSVEFDTKVINIMNKLFFCTEDEIRENCNDKNILRDIEENPFENEFMLKQIDSVKHLWVEDTKQLYDFCKNYVLSTLDKRKDVNYASSTDAADASFVQVRACIWSETLEEELIKRMAICKDWLRKGIEEYGFVSELEEEL